MYHLLKYIYFQNLKDADNSHLDKTLIKLYTLNCKDLNCTKLKNALKTTKFIVSVKKLFSASNNSLNAFPSFYS